MDIVSFIILILVLIVLVLLVVYVAQVRKEERLLQESLKNLDELERLHERVAKWLEDTSL